MTTNAESPGSTRPAGEPSGAWVAFALALLVLAAYGPSLRNEFVFDDLIFVEKDTRVRSIVESPRLFVEPLWHLSRDPVRPGAHAYYRPLQLLPLSVSHALFGDAAWPCHLLSLVLHWLNAMLAFSIFRALVERSAAALLAAALFAVHPAYSEAVFWFSDVAGLGVAFSTLAIFRMHITPGGVGFAGRVAMAVLFLAALWFKETGIVAPLVLALYDLVIGGRGRRAFLSYAAFAVAFSAYLYFRWQAMGGLSLGLQSIRFTPLELVANAIALLPGYVVTFFWPFRLNFYHVFVAIDGLASPRFILGLTILAVAVIAFLGTVRRHRPLALGIGWALVTVAPYLLPRWTELNVYAERYLYLPSVGIFLAVAYIWGQVLQGSMRASMKDLTPAVVTIAVVLLTFTVTVARRALDWHDDITLYSHTLERSPDAKLILNNLGVKFYELGRYEEGIPLLERLIALDADFPSARQNLALLYNGVGRLEEAAAKFEEAAKAEPGNPTVFLNRGYVYDRLGRRDEAVASYIRATRLNPNEAMAWQNLAVIAFETGQFGNAETAVRRVLAIDPGDTAARKLAASLAGRTPHRSASGEPASAETLRRCEEARRVLEQKRRQDAIFLLEAAAWLDEASPLPHQYLANVFAMNGNVMLALRQMRLALDRDPGNQLYERNLQSLRRALMRRGQRRMQLPDKLP